MTNGGEPIPEAELGRLFQPYYRVKSVRRREGLGLFIASQIAEAHAGTLTAASNADGTIFTLRMPVGR